MFKQILISIFLLTSVVWGQITTYPASSSGGGGSVTHTCGGLTSGYVIVGNASGDICIQTGAHFDGSNNLILPAGISTGGAASGNSAMSGSSSGTVTVTVAAAAGTWTLTLPTSAGSSGQALITDGSGIASWASRSDNKRGFGYTFNGAGTALVAGQTGYLTIPFACTISAWNMSVDTGTATVDVWKIATGTAIPTVSNTITASALPAIASNTSLHSTTLTGWTTAVAANDIVGINLKTTASATVVNLTLECDQ